MKSRITLYIDTVFAPVMFARSSKCKPGCHACTEITTEAKRARDAVAQLSLNCDDLLAVACRHLGEAAYPGVDLEPYSK